MVDIDPAVFSNPNRGVSHLPFLDEIQAQEQENFNAKAENRPPRKVKSRDRFGAGEMGPIEFEDTVPAFTETSMEDYFQTQEIERVNSQEQLHDEQLLAEVEAANAAAIIAISPVANEILPPVTGA